MVAAPRSAPRRGSTSGSPRWPSPTCSGPRVLLRPFRLKQVAYLDVALIAGLRVPRARGLLRRLDARAPREPVALSSGAPRFSHSSSVWEALPQSSPRQRREVARRPQTYRPGTLKIALWARPSPPSPSTSPGRSTRPRSSASPPTLPPLDHHALRPSSRWAASSACSTPRAASRPPTPCSATSPSCSPSSPGPPSSSCSSTACGPRRDPRPSVARRVGPGRPSPPSPSPRTTTPPCGFCLRRPRRRPPQRGRPTGSLAASPPATWAAPPRAASSGTRRPLTRSPSPLDWRLTGGRPVFHLTNVLLHAAAAVVVAAPKLEPPPQRRRCRRHVFAVHPPHTDAYSHRRRRLRRSSPFLADAVTPPSAVACVVGARAPRRDARQGVRRAPRVPLSPRATCDGVPWRRGARAAPSPPSPSPSPRASAVLGGSRGNRPPSAARNPRRRRPRHARRHSVRTFGHAVRLTPSRRSTCSPTTGPAAVAPSTALDDVVVLGATAIALFRRPRRDRPGRRQSLGDAALWTLVIGLAAVNVPVLLPRPSPSAGGTRVRRRVPSLRRRPRPRPPAGSASPRWRS